MVTSRIVSQFTGELPQLGTDRKIKGLKCPLYEPAAILGILEQQQPIPWTSGCISDVRKL